MIIARWHIEARFGHKQTVIDSLKKWCDDIGTEIGCHSFRATGITAYMRNGGKLETAQEMAGHESARTTSLDNRAGDEIRAG